MNPTYLETLQMPIIEKYALTCSHFVMNLDKWSLMCLEILIPNIVNFPFVMLVSDMQMCQKREGIIHSQLVDKRFYNFWVTTSIACCKWCCSKPLTTNQTTICIVNVNSQFPKTIVSPNQYETVRNQTRTNSSKLTEMKNI